MNIAGTRVMLRAIEIIDLEPVHRWANDPEIQGQLGGWHFPLSKTSLATWIQSFRHDSCDQRFIIDAPGAGPIGIATLTQINWKDRNAFEGILIGEPGERRKGHATDALAALSRYAFEELGLERLDTTIVEFNDASLKLHEDCGWVREGRKERAVFRKNRFWTNVLLGMTRSSYELSLKGVAERVTRERNAVPMRNSPG